MSETKGQYIVNGKDQILLNDLKEQAIKLKNKISNGSSTLDWTTPMREVIVKSMKVVSI